MNNHGFLLFGLGSLLGVVVFSFVFAYEGVVRVEVTEYFLSSDILATIISGFGGAIIGGCATLFVAMRAEKENRSREKNMSYMKDKSTLLSLIIKLSIIHNNNYSTLKYIDESISNLPEGGEKWTVVMSMAGFFDLPDIQPDDMVPLATSNNADLINRIIQFSSKSRSSEVAFRRYCELRADFQKFSEGKSRIDGSSGVRTVFAGAEADIAKLRAFEMEQLIQQVHGFLKEIKKEGYQLFKDLEIFNKEYMKGKGEFVSIITVLDE